MQNTMDAPFTFKDLSATFEVKELNDEFARIEGFASTFGNVDRTGDIIEKGAFLNSIDEHSRKNRQIKLLSQHNMKDVIGIIDDIFEEEEGLFIRARMPRDHSMVKDIVPLLKMGALGDFSIGFNVKESDKDSDGNRIIKEADLWEVSIVSVPANPKAQILNVKGAVPFQDFAVAPRDMRWDGDAAVTRLRRFYNSEETPSQNYRRGFLWFDDESSELFTSYKLPIIDIINGEPMAVPRGIFAAAQTLRGARGGVDIPDEDRPGVIANLERYFDKMGLESPFVNEERGFFNIGEVKKIQDRREFETMLIETGLFSKEARVYLASCFVPKRSDSVQEEEKRSESVSDGSEALAKSIKDLIEMIQIKGI